MISRSGAIGGDLCPRVGSGQSHGGGPGGEAPKELELLTFLGSQNNRFLYFFFKYFLLDNLCKMCQTLM